jgi:hypothetical protein
MRRFRKPLTGLPIQRPSRGRTAVRPYYRLPEIALKERQGLAQGVSPWDSLLCVSVPLW